MSAFDVELMTVSKTFSTAAKEKNFHVECLGVIWQLQKAAK